MTRGRLPAFILFAIGMMGLGVLALVYGDFALVWQPVPSGLWGRTVLAYSSGVLMLFAGGGLLVRATAAWSARLLLPYMIVWVLLKVPAVVVAPQMEAVWLGIGEIAILLAGAWVLFCRFSLASGETNVRWAQFLLALSLIPIGLSHLVYVKQTADLVPVWLPFRTGWAYLTGIGQMACGLAILTNVHPRIAAMIEVGMLASFTLLVWGTTILHQPSARLPWTAFFISWAIAAAAWVVATAIPTKRTSVQ